MGTLQKTTSTLHYTINGKEYTVQLIGFKPAKPVSQMFSYVAGEDVSCEEKKMTWNSDSSAAYPVWTRTTFRRLVVNRKTEYKCMTEAEAQELKQLVCSESVSLSLQNNLNGWWSASLSETVKGDWYRVYERHTYE